MDRATEERWRTALKKKGLEVVQVELDMRPGRAGDICYDVGDEPPYPTRAFVENWCRGKPPKPFGPSGTTAMIIGMSLLFVVCIIRALSSFSPSEKDWLSDGAVPYVREAVPTMRGSSASSDDTVQNSSVINSKQQPSIRAACNAVSSAGDGRTVQMLPECSKLGTGTTQHK
jgi:hypothetical protein